MVSKEISGQCRKVEKTSTILKNAQKIVYRKDHLKITLQITIMKNCDSYSFASLKISSSGIKLFLLRKKKLKLTKSRKTVL